MNRTADADEGADDGADAAEERRAADHRAGDGQEHVVRAALQRDDRRRSASSRRCPAKPASTLASTKLPILIQRTLTPASAAPIRFPPVAIVCSPQRVQAEQELHGEDDSDRPAELRVQVEGVLIRLRAEDVLEHVAAGEELLRAGQQVQGDPVQQEQHPERGDERGHAAVRRDHAADEPDHRPRRRARRSPRPRSAGCADRGPRRPTRSPARARRRGRPRDRSRRRSGASPRPPRSARSAPSTR